MLLLLWCALGLQVSWGKGTRGFSVPWIGARIEVAMQRYPSGRMFPGVWTELQQERFDEMRSNVAKVSSAKGLIPLKLVKTVAGQLSWASGIFPWIKSFNAALWAGITACSSSSCISSMRLEDIRARKS